MKVLSSIEIAAVVKELQFLVTSKLSKIYQPDKDEAVFAFHVTGEGKSLLRIVPGFALYLTDRKKPSPQRPYGFCSFLRKRLQNARLEKVEQKHFERIIEFTFSTKENKFILIAEFFSKGNIILTDEDYIILSALQVQRWKDRTIKAKEKYLYPPSKVNVFNLSYEDFRKIVLESDKENIVKTLALDFGFGGEFSEKLCLSSKVDKNKKEVAEKELKSLFKAIETLLKLKDFVDFNEQLNKYYSEFIEDELEVEEKQTVSKIDKQELVIESQKKRLETASKSVEENTERGNKIYEHYVYLKEIFDTVEKARSKNITWVEIKEKLKTKDIELDVKDKRVILDLK